MILIKCNDDFFLKNITSLLEQKNLKILKDQSFNFFYEISIDLYGNKISIKNKNKIISFQTPLLFSTIFSNIYALLSDSYISIGKLKYNPLTQCIVANKNTHFLGSIHNLIISNLILNKDGLSRSELYSLIWPNDKDIQINKLDTHLTNLKKKISQDLFMDLNFISNLGNLKLVID